MVESYQIDVPTNGQGLYEITREIANFTSKVSSGLANIFVQHTSCSLVIQENADPSARQDLNKFLDRLAPSNQSWHSHTAEGPDDTTSHMKSALTNTFLTIPVLNGQLALGTWQGIYLWEHRQPTNSRKIVVSLLT